MNTRLAYPSDITDAQWPILLPLVPAAKSCGRPNIYTRREITNGIFYLVRTGCAWRYLPHDLPPHKIVNYYYNAWRKDGSWQQIHDTLRDLVRQQYEFR